MTDEELNKRIHEIFGLCQHEWDEWLGDYEYPSRSARCVKCSVRFKESLSCNFVTSWEGFGILWAFLKNHEKWGEIKSILTHEYCWVEVISPRALSEVTVKIFEEELKDDLCNLF